MLIALLIITYSNLILFVLSVIIVMIVMQRLIISLGLILSKSCMISSIVYMILLLSVSLLLPRLVGDIMLQFQDNNVIASLDWLTLMFHDYPLRKIFEFLGDLTPGDEEYNAAMSKHFVCDKIGFPNCWQMPLFCGAQLFIRTQDIYETLGHSALDDSFAYDYSKIYDIYLPWIRLDFSAGSLRTLRRMKFDIDSLVFHGFIDFSTGEDKFALNGFPGRSFYRVTRADFAFDLVNYCVDDKGFDFLDHCSNLCKRYHRDNLVPCGSTGMSYEVTAGRKRIVRLGSGGANHCVRIYDKFLELKDKLFDPAVYPFDDFLEPDSIKSWIRIELQTRNNSAERLLLLEDEFRAVFVWLYDHFAIRQGFPERGRPAHSVSPMWQKIFDIEDKEVVALNSYFVQLDIQDNPSDPLETAKTVNRRMLGCILKEFSAFGVENTVNSWLKEFYQMQQSPVPSERLRAIRIVNGIHLLTNDFSQLPGIYFDNSILKFKSYTLSEFDFDSYLTLCKSELYNSRQHLGDKELAIVKDFIDILLYNFNLR